MNMNSIIYTRNTLNQSSTNQFYIHRSGFYKSSGFTTNINWNAKPTLNILLNVDKSMYLYKPHSNSSNIMGGTGSSGRAIRLRT